MIKLLVKLGIVIIGILLLLAIIGLSIYYFYLKPISYDYIDQRLAIISGDRNLVNELINEGYEIKFPAFYSRVTNFGIDYTPVAAALYVPCSDYAQTVSDKYEYYAKLDYTVEIIANETLTVMFYGFGYPDKGEGKPVSLDKKFIFDIRGVNADNFPDVLPKLISD